MSTSFGYDVNNPEGSDKKFARGSVKVPDAYFTAIVEDIIINNKNGKVLKYRKDGSNIGQAKVRLLPADQNTQIENLNDAYPMDMNIQGFPLPGEQVIVFKASGKLFYTRLAVKKKITENKTLSTQKKFTEVKGNVLKRLFSTTGVPTNNIANDEIETEKFRLNINARPVKAYVGDILLQGRYGNVIRMGSSAFKNPDVIVPHPNILLTAGAWSTPATLSTEEITPYSLTEESINNDKSSIWMVADQDVPFLASTVDSLSHLLSSVTKTSDYVGAQIFINSDRVILNSKKNEISLFSKNEINLSSVKAITLDTDDDIFLRSFASINIVANGAVYLKGQSIQMESAENLTYKTDGDYGISGNRIFIGKYGDTTQPMVLGTDLASFISTLLQNVTRLSSAVSSLASGIVTLSSPGAYNSASPGSPIVPTGAASVRGVAQSVNQSIQNTVNPELQTLTSGVASPSGAIFNSVDNFVSRTNK